MNNVVLLLPLKIKIKHLSKLVLTIATKYPYSKIVILNESVKLTQCFYACWQ